VYIESLTVCDTSIIVSVCYYNDQLLQTMSNVLHMIYQRRATKTLKTTKCRVWNRSSAGGGQCACSQGLKNSHMICIRCVTATLAHRISINTIHQEIRHTYFNLILQLTATNISAK